MLTKARIRKLMADFTFYDRDMDGKLDPFEFLTASLRVDSDRDILVWCHVAFYGVDRDHDGRITLGEAISIIRPETDEAVAELTASFRSIDSNGDGKIDFAELLELFVAASGNSPEEPYVISGKGSGAAPAGALSLYTHANFNGSSNANILVIPEGAAANDFSDYGFDQSIYGVSGVVNNTSRNSVLFKYRNQTGPTLSFQPGDAVSVMPQGWNDGVQSALAHSDPVPIPVFTAPEPDAADAGAREEIEGTSVDDAEEVLLYEGNRLLESCVVGPAGEWTYTPTADWDLGRHDVQAMAVRDGIRSGKAQRTFYVTESSPVVTIYSPADDAEVSSAAAIDGMAFNTPTVQLLDNGAELGSVPVISDRWSYAPAGGWEGGDHSVTAEAVDGGDPATVNFSVSVQNLTVRSEFIGAYWSPQPQNLSYSYRIIMEAGDVSVRHWNVEFGQLPSGSVLEPAFSNNFWGVIISDGSDGRVVLGSPPEGTHVIPAHGELSIDVQVIIPRNPNDGTYETLFGLVAKGLT
ncbi:EF-hand domain-containing protein [Streptomyces goshikiensis]|uniref:EF-hand domain-containing protein n=1 Tax=Streptomyces goshikiensis TaxID=1942 RepID=UPI0036C65515